MWGEEEFPGFKLPGNLCITCDTQTHTFVELLLTGGTAAMGKRNSCLHIRKQLLCPVELWTQWEWRSAAAAHGAVNQLQVLALHDSVFCKTSLEAAIACGISSFTRSRDSCLLLKSKCNCFSKQVVKTLSKTQVFRWHSIICQLLNWFIEIVTTNLEHDNCIPCLLPLKVLSWGITFSRENCFPLSLIVHITKHLP